MVAFCSVISKRMLNMEMVLFDYSHLLKVSGL